MTLTPSLPYGARQIAELRSTGKRPADMVLVSLIGPLRESNPAVIAKPGRAYDWRFLVGLSVLLVVTTETPGLPGIVQSIGAMQPATLAVWFADQQDGINLIIEGYRPRTKTGRRMSLWQRANYAGLGSNEPAYDCLRKIAGQVKQRIMNSTHQPDGVLMEMATAGLTRIFGKAWREAA